MREGAVCSVISSPSNSFSPDASSSDFPSDSSITTAISKTDALLRQSSNSSTAAWMASWSWWLDISCRNAICVWFLNFTFDVGYCTVTVDNASNKKATLIKVDSANKRGSLLEVVQVLTHLNLIIRRAYISSSGEWFMDVFHVTDQQGNKISEDNIVERIQQSLGPKGQNFRSLTRSVGLTPTAEHTTIELSGRAYALLQDGIGLRVDILILY
ncbi:unnamed protein product [Fraxinus pennsylvanica]|uniref:ACT domain-containing protein ACR n=1 Tax=Fraxinus pennsylvanica TaxID=56036 RepID=A0AAD2AA76_9LAMI|nr:unnamed protein product [Fraxinus pennsylvanica]